MVVGKILDDIMAAWQQYNQNGWLFSLGIIMYYTASRIIKYMLKNSSQHKSGRSRQWIQKDWKRRYGHWMVRFSVDMFLVWIFAVYLFFVINLTLFSREAGSRGELNLFLFCFLEGGDIKKAEALENILLLFPCGMLLPMLSNRLRSSGPGLAAGFLISLLIETIQLITGCGYFELDDILLNGLGAAAGYGIFRLSEAVMKRIRT